VGKLLKTGIINEEEARNHPRRNVLYQSIGLKKDINIQALGAFPIEIGQKYLLCSDGLYGVVSNDEIREHLRERSTARVSQQLVQLAKKGGGPDNITVIVVSTEKDDDVELPDTAKIVVPTPGKGKLSKVWYLLLLGLLVLLLAIIIYFLVRSVDTNLSLLPGPGQNDLAGMVIPGSRPGAG
jgi:hypothetical protein